MLQFDRPVVRYNLMGYGPLRFLSCQILDLVEGQEIFCPQAIKLNVVKSVLMVKLKHIIHPISDTFTFFFLSLFHAIFLRVLHPVLNPFSIQGVQFSIYKTVVHASLSPFHIYLEPSLCLAMQHLVWLCSFIQKLFVNEINF